MNDRTPLVTVVIPTYNRANFIATAIESVLAQTYPNIQLVVVDDGSTDETESIVKRYTKAEYILIPHGGQAAARNGGLKHAKGTILASLDSDDKWDPNFLEFCITKLEKDKLDFVFTNWNQELPDEGRFSDFLSHDEYLKPHVKKGKEIWYTLTNEQLRKIYLATCPSPSSSAVIRKSSIISGWNENIHVGDDWCMYVDMIVFNKDCTAAFTMNKLWYKHVNANNVFDGRVRNELLELFYIEDTLTFMNRYYDNLTKKERRVLNKRCIRGYVELAKHHVFRNRNFGKAILLMHESMKISNKLTLLAVPTVIFSGFDRHRRDLLFKLQKKSI
jgi:glycosyltransferase involved in cell wall biosynthesis